MSVVHVCDRCQRHIPPVMYNGRWFRVEQQASKEEVLYTDLCGIECFISWVQATRICTDIIVTQHIVYPEPYDVGGTPAILELL